MHVGPLQPILLVCSSYQHPYWVWGGFSWFHRMASLGMDLKDHSVPILSHRRGCQPLDQAAQATAQCGAISKLLRVHTRSHHLSLMFVSLIKTLRSSGLRMEPLGGPHPPQTKSHWPQPSGRAHPTNPLSTEHATLQICLSPIQRGCGVRPHQRVCTRQGEDQAVLHHGGTTRALLTGHHAMSLPARK